MWRKPFLIIIQISILFAFASIGTFIQQYFKLIIPGSVIGLILLFIFLLLKIIPEKWISEGAGFMTKHLILFFIPATVGMINYYHLFIGKGFFLVIITIISSLLVLITSGYVSEKLSTRRSTKNG